MTGISKLQTVFGGVDGASGTGRADATHTPPSSLQMDQAGGAQGANQAVRVSGSASAMALASADSDVRTDKVAKLQAAIAAGTYKVSSSDVADSLMNSMLKGKGW